MLTSSARSPGQLPSSPFPLSPPGSNRRWWSFNPSNACGTICKFNCFPLSFFVSCIASVLSEDMKFAHAFILTASLHQTSGQAFLNISWFSEAHFLAGLSARLGKSDHWVLGLLQLFFDGLHTGTIVWLQSLCLIFYFLEHLHNFPLSSGAKCVSNS